jgi:hypothetical protein
MRKSAWLYSGLIAFSLVGACSDDNSPGSEAEETGDGDGDGDGDSGDGDGDGEAGDGDGDQDTGDGDGDLEGGDGDGDGDGEGDGDGDGDGDIDVTISMSNVQISGNFMPIVPPDPWDASFTLTVQNGSGQPVTLNHFASSIIFNPSPNNNNGPDEFESNYEIDMPSIDAPVGQSVHMLNKTSMDSVPDETFCAWPVQLDNITFEIEGTQQLVVAGSPPTDAGCVF